MWIPQYRMALGTTDLYWNENTTYRVSIARGDPRQDLRDSSQVELIQEATTLLLRSIHGSQLPDYMNGFPMIFLPPEVKDIKSWIDQMQGVKEARESLNGCSPTEIGLVRPKSHSGRAYFYESMEISGGKSKIVCNNIPERSDFFQCLPGRSTAHTRKQSFLADECLLDRLPTKYALFAAFVPSIMHRVECALLVKDLHNITYPRALKVSNYNHLRLVGYYSLKYCTTLQVMATNTWSRAHLDEKRAQIMRAVNAATTATPRHFNITKSFSNTDWKALFGAAYLDGGIIKASQCIRALIPHETWHEPSQCFQTLIDLPRSTESTSLAVLERLVGHTFEHPELLAEATELPGVLGLGENSPHCRLEFLGDSVLDMIVVTKLIAHSAKFPSSNLQSIHTALINNNFLGYFCLQYYQDEATPEVSETSSGSMETREIARQVRLYDLSPALGNASNAEHSSVRQYDKLNIEADLTRGNYPWASLATLNPPKSLADLIEAILGAIYIDTRGNLEVCEAFLKKIGFIGVTERLLRYGRLESASRAHRKSVCA
jgi:dsRNA-specific ribonuclease